MEAENGLGSLDPGAQEFRPARPPPPLRLPGPNQNSFIPLLLSPCYPYNLQQHQNQQLQGPLPPPPPPPPPYPPAAGLGGGPHLLPRLPHLHEILYPNAPPTAPAYVSPNTTANYFMTNTMATHYHTSSLHSPPPVTALPSAAIAPIPAQLPPPPSSTPTRALLLSAVPTDVSETIVRRGLEVFGDVRAVQMERARREGIVTVHFYDMRAAHAAMEEIREQHMQQQNRLRIHYTSCFMISPPGGIVDGTYVPPAPCPPPAKGLIAGRAVWAQFTFPATDAYPDGLNQGTLVVFNMDSQITTSKLRDIFEPFGAVRELRETPMKKHQRFVEFYDVRDAAKALSAMNGKEINGKQVVIEFSRPGGHNSKKLFFSNNNNNNTGGGSSSNYPHHHKKNYQNGHHYSNRAAFNRNNIKFPSHHPPAYHPQEAAAAMMSASPVQPRRITRQSRRGVLATTSYLPSRALYDNTLLEDEQGLNMVSCRGNRHSRKKSSSSDDHTNASESPTSVDAAMRTLTLGYMDHESLEMQRSSGINVGQCSKMVYTKRTLGSIGSSNGGSSSSSSGGGGDCSKQRLLRLHGKGRVGGKGSWKGGKQKKSFDPRFLIKEEIILVSDSATGSSSSRDTRTTVMIKNIPNKYSQKLLLNMLDNHCIHCNEQIAVTAGAAADGSVPLSSYDFAYLPIDFNNKCNVGYGFVNMTSPEATLRLYKAFHQQHWEVFNSRKICEVTYARVQGLEALKEHFKNSKFACETDEYLPVIFSPPRDGRRSLTHPLPIVAHHQQHRSPKSISMDGGDYASSSSIFTAPSDDNIIIGEDDGHQHDDDVINGDDGDGQRDDGIDGGGGAPPPPTTSTSSSSSSGSGAYILHHHEYHEGGNECFEQQKLDDVVVTDVGLGSGIFPPSNGGDITHDSDIPAAATGFAS